MWSSHNRLLQPLYETKCVILLKQTNLFSLSPVPGAMKLWCVLTSSTTDRWRWHLRFTMTSSTTRAEFITTQASKTSLTPSRSRTMLFCLWVTAQIWRTRMRQRNIGSWKIAGVRGGGRMDTSESDGEPTNAALKASLYRLSLSCKLWALNQCLNLPKVHLLAINSESANTHCILANRQK